MSHTLRLALIALLFLELAGVSFAADKQMPKKKPIISSPAEQKPGEAAPFSIPQIDLSANKEIQVVVDREAGQYLGHPTTVLLEDGKTMIIVYPKGHGRGAIVMKRSTDAGLTWSDRLPTPASWATSLEVPTIYRTVDKAGKKRLVMFSGLYPIRRAVSEDDGATWSELEPVGDYGGIVACASCVRLKNGDYMALFHDDGRFLTKEGRPKGSPQKFVLYKILSSDGGLTWSKPIVILTPKEGNLCEPGAVRSPDGKQIAVLLRENSRKLPSQFIFSDDEGETWTAPKPLPATLTGDRHTCAYLSDGKLFITFRDMLKGGPTPGDWVAWVGTYDDLVHGREGLYRLRLMDNTKGADCAYPPVEVLPDGTIVTTTYGHWTEGEMPYIVSVRIPEALQAVFSRFEMDARYRQTIIPFTTTGILTPQGSWKFSFSIDRPYRTFSNDNERRVAEMVNEIGGGNVSIVPPSNKLSPTWKRLPDLSDPRGFAGQFAGVSGGKLVMYGGTNFQDKPNWDGGVKSWYHDVYLLDAPGSEWREAGALPDDRAVGYGVSLTTPEGIVCIGGADAVKHTTDVFYLNVDGDKLTTRDLPKLPQPCAYMSGAMIGSVVYVAGGIDKPDAVRTMRTFWSLDLKNLDAGWQQLDAWPGPGRMLHVMAAVGDSIYLSGGTDLWPGPDGKPMRTYLNDSYKYTPGQGWTKTKSAPTGIVAAPVPAIVDDKRIIVFGGDNGARLGFRPPEKHPGFPNDVYQYDTTSDEWKHIGQAPFVPVATPVVPWHNGYVVVSGEIRPCVRTREAWWVSAR